MVGVAVMALSLATGLARAADLQLAPFKDELFRYPGIIETADDGAFVRVDYSERRDLDERDEIPERKVKGDYVSLQPRWSQSNMTFTAGGRRIKYIAAGKVDGGAKVIVLYIHGQGGSRFQGADDWRFGGNFNRIKNLMTRNDGLYISTDFSDFGERGKDEIKTLIAEQTRRAPGAAIFVACGSMGGAICWRLAEDAEAAAMISGLLFLGSMWNSDFLKTPMLRERAKWVPIYFGHGGSDKVFAAETQITFYRQIRKAAPGYPLMFALFETGTHGTPIRMTDWRLVLNWMLKIASN